MKRCTGKTTRLVDYYIQELFNSGTTGIIKDVDGAKQGDYVLYLKILSRLQFEHNFNNLVGKKFNHTESPYSVYLID